MPCPSWVKNPFLKKHLQYVNNTESPVIMHIWSAISAAAAAMGRHVWLEQGTGNMFPNMYILLVGPPGVRKNSAINYAVKILRESTGVKFAPDDTGGQRQGLIVALEDSESDDVSAQLGGTDLADINLLVKDDVLSSLGKVKLNLTADDPDAHALYICATEFGSFLGQGSLDMTRFLIKMWDAEDYTYKIRKEYNILKNPLLNLLGGTTAADLSTLLPPEAIGQGFMSRIILVFASQKAKRLPPSKSFLNNNLSKDLEKVYKFLFETLEGKMIMSNEAAKVSDKIYMEDIKIADTRFIHYSERRQDHLTKLAMVLAATKMSDTIAPADMEEANNILLQTERTMTDALGEYGLSPLAVARQKMVEFIQHANGPVSDNILWMMLRKDMRMLDFKNCLSELINARKILQVKTKQGTAFVYNEDLGGIADLLSEEK